MSVSMIILHNGIKKYLLTVRMYEFDTRYEIDIARMNIDTQIENFILFKSWYKFNTNANFQTNNNIN